MSDRGSTAPVGIAILGCGYVADFYMATLPRHPMLRACGAFDRDPARLAAFAGHHRIPAYPTLAALLADPAVELVLNLTSPRSHHEVTRACLEAGKHVYSEKPLAMDSGAAQQLVELASGAGLQLASAPCSLLGETCQTLWKALRDGLIGVPRLVYANFDDGMVHRMRPDRWRSASGAPWPAANEFETGCTYEHAGYVLTWLAAMFGPARRVTAYASCRLPDKGLAVPMAPDFTVGCIEYDDVVARVTCSIVAPLDRSIAIAGDGGVLRVNNLRDDAAAVRFTPTPPGRLAAAVLARMRGACDRLEAKLDPRWTIAGPSAERRVRFARRPTLVHSGPGKPVDFLRGPQEQAEAIREHRPCRLSSGLGAHIVELVETLQYPERFVRPRVLQTGFPPIAPLPWRA